LQIDLSPENSSIAELEFSAIIKVSRRALVKARLYTEEQIITVLREGGKKKEGLTPLLNCPKQWQLD
jgi:hypothetical protein